MNDAVAIENSSGIPPELQKLVKNQLFLFPEWELNNPEQGHNNRLDNIVRTDTKLSVRNSKKTPKNHGR